MGKHVTLLRTRGGTPQPIEPEELVSALQRLGSPYVLVPDARADARLVDPAVPDGVDVIFVQAGELWASDPSDTLLATMLGLARELGGRVRDDAFATYRGVDDTYLHPDDARLLAQWQRPAQRRRGVSAVVPICVGVLLGILVLLLRR